MGDKPQKPVPFYARTSPFWWGVCGGVILLFVVGSLVCAPQERSRREIAARMACARNLQQIGFALRLYAQDFGGRYPADAEGTAVGSFALLIRKYQTDFSVWICPGDAYPEVEPGSADIPLAARNLSYAYGGWGLTTNAPADTPLALDESPHSPGGGNVLFADGRVLFVTTNFPSMENMRGSRVLGAAREKARRSTCLNNLKQIGLAIRLYSGDHGGWFPCDPARTTIGSFALLTNEYQTSYATWTCPSDVGVVRGSSTGSFISANCSYAYGGLGLNEDASPSTPLACDRSSSANWTGAHPWAGNKWTHKSDGGNVLFADGHVVWVETTVPGMHRMKNP